ncbi:hypothetical protein Pcinc_009254 [Petrolisthes cinctipes]|nr:hypothetical protein Pcinc_009254 [Petrolisthes cinctipes]
MACGILHNTCKRLNIPLQEEDKEAVDDPDDMFQPAPNGLPQGAAIFRENLAWNHFIYGTVSAVLLPDCYGGPTNGTTSPMQTLLLERGGRHNRSTQEPRAH